MTTPIGMTLLYPGTGGNYAPLDTTWSPDRRRPGRLLLTFLNGADGAIYWSIDPDTVQALAVGAFCSFDDGTITTAAHPLPEFSWLTLTGDPQPGKPASIRLVARRKDMIIVLETLVQTPTIDTSVMTESEIDAAARDAVENLEAWLELNTPPG